MNPYRVLGVAKDATQEEIRAAWLDAAKEHHPDKGGDEEQFKKTKQAYDVLSDPQMRASYDSIGVMPNTPEAKLYEVLSNVFKGHLARACEQGKIINLQYVLDENTNAITQFKNNIEQLNNQREIIVKSMGEIQHSRSKRSKVDCFSLACAAMLEQVDQSIKANEKNMSDASEIREMIKTYSQKNKAKPVRGYLSINDVQIIFQDEGTHAPKKYNRR